MEKSITVRILGRSYSLRVKPEDEDAMREIAGYVDQRMTAFRTSFPRQQEITTAVIAAISIAEELFASRQIQAQSSSLDADTERELDALADLLGQALEAPTNGQQEHIEEE